MHKSNGTGHASLKILASFLCVVVAGACSTNKVPHKLDALIVDGAYNVRQDQLGHPAVTQLSYQVNIPYPRLAISVEKMQSLKQQGWHQCMQLFRGEWEHFGELTTMPPRMVHQYGTSFAKDLEYLVIAMRYLSADPAKDPTESKPDNDIQHVYILHYDLSAKEVQTEIGKDVESCLHR